MIILVEFCFSEADCFTEVYRRDVGISLSVVDFFYFLPPLFLPPHLQWLKNPQTCLYRKNKNRRKIITAATCIG